MEYLVPGLYVIGTCWLAEGVIRPVIGTLELPGGTRMIECQHPEYVITSTNKCV